MGVTCAPQAKHARGGCSRQYSVRPWPARRVVASPLVLSSSHEQPSEPRSSCPPGPRLRGSDSQQTAMQGRRVGGMEDGDPNETRAWSPRFQRPGSRSTRPTRCPGLPAPALAGGPLLYPCPLVGPPLEPILTGPIGIKGRPTRLAPDHRSPFSARRWQGRQLRFIRCCTGGEAENENGAQFARPWILGGNLKKHTRKKTHAMRALLSNANKMRVRHGQKYRAVGRFVLQVTRSTRPPIGPSSDHAGFFA